MKKLIFAIAATAVMGISANAAEVTGSILSTDIGTLIDGAPCKTYNVDGRTFVIAEDLRGYGFDVVYDDSIRRLTITQNPYSERTILSKEEINIAKNSITVGQWLGDMFATDITVYLGNSQIEAYAIDGQMVIPVRALESCAYVEFDSSDKIVTVSGLQHYLNSRYESGNPYIALEASEEEVEVYKKYNGVLETKVISSYNDISKITTCTDTEHGKITACWGNPYTEYSYLSNYYGELYDKEQYTIKDSNGNLLYDMIICRQTPADEENHAIRYGYLRNSSKIIIPEDKASNLYRYKVITEKDYYNGWPSDNEVDNARFDRFSQSGYLISDDNIAYSGKKPLRYNVTDASIYYVLSLDGKLYQKTESGFGNEVNCIFDECIAENVKKFNKDLLILTTDGKLCQLNRDSDEEIASGIKDFAGYYDYYIAAIDENDNLRIATKNDYINGNANIADTDVKSVYISENGKEVCYIKNHGELYRYSLTTWSTQKLADNIRKIVNNTWFITENDELSNLTNIIATDVKDAYIQSFTMYILKNDNTTDSIFIQ